MSRRNPTCCCGPKCPCDPLDWRECGTCIFSARSITNFSLTSFQQFRNYRVDQTGPSVFFDGVDGCRWLVPVITRDNTGGGVTEEGTATVALGNGTWTVSDFPIYINDFYSGPFTGCFAGVNVSAGTQQDGSFIADGSDIGASFSTTYPTPSGNWSVVIAVSDTFMKSLNAKITVGSCSLEVTADKGNNIKEMTLTANNAAPLVFDIVEQSVVFIAREATDPDTDIRSYRAEALGSAVCDATDPAPPIVTDVPITILGGDLGGVIVEQAFICLTVFENNACPAVGGCCVQWQGIPVLPKDVEFFTDAEIAMDDPNYTPFLPVGVKGSRSLVLECETKIIEAQNYESLSAVGGPSRWITLMAEASTSRVIDMARYKGVIVAKYGDAAPTPDAPLVTNLQEWLDSLSDAAFMGDYIRTVWADYLPTGARTFDLPVGSPDPGLTAELYDVTLSDRPYFDGLLVTG